MRHPDLELDLLRAFVAVAETGSFTASTLASRQPCNTRRIARSSALCSWVAAMSSRCRASAAWAARERWPEAMQNPQSLRWAFNP